jgi:hypothetical protein
MFAGGNHPRFSNNADQLIEQRHFFADTSSNRMRVSRLRRNRISGASSLYDRQFMVEIVTDQLINGE